jgi:hypothetical protein
MTFFFKKHEFNTGHSENMGSLIYIVLPNAGTFHYQNITIIIPLLTVCEKYSWGYKTELFQNSNLYLKGQILTLATDITVLHKVTGLV